MKVYNIYIYIYIYIYILYYLRTYIYLKVDHHSLILLKFLQYHKNKLFYFFNLMYLSLIL